MFCKHTRRKIRPFTSPARLPVFDVKNQPEFVFRVEKRAMHAGGYERRKQERLKVKVPRLKAPSSFVSKVQAGGKADTKGGKNPIILTRQSRQSRQCTINRTLIIMIIMIWTDLFEFFGLSHLRPIFPLRRERPIPVPNSGLNGISF